MTLDGPWINKMARASKIVRVKRNYVRPIHGFTAQVSSAAVILGASLAGGPVSTSQVVSASIVGAGAAERKSKVRWSLLGEIALAWLVTLPVAALLAAALYWVLDALLLRSGALGVQR